MKRMLLFALLAAVGCQKAPSPSPARTVPATPAASAKKVIESGKPEFDTMLAAFKADPKTTKFAREIVTFKMTVESVKEVDKQTYLVKGKGEGANLVVTFLLPANLQLNQQARHLGAGDTVTYWAEPAEYTPGDPPTITSLSGSIMSVGSAPKPSR